MRTKKIAFIAMAVLFQIALVSCATMRATGTGETLLWKNGLRETDRAVLNKDITIFARLPNVADGTKVKITISEMTTKKENPLAYELESTVKHGKVKALWRVKYDVDDETDLGFGENYEQPSYVFCVNYDGKMSEVSKPVKLFCDLYMKLEFRGRVLKGYPYCLKLADGSYREGETNKDGLIIEKEIPVGAVRRLF